MSPFDHPAWKLHLVYLGGEIARQESLTRVRVGNLHLLEMLKVKKMDLLVSYPWRQFFPARLEAIGMLKQFGDPDPKIERTDVSGIAIVHTTLNNREVIKKCRELFHKEPAFEFTMKWVPVDSWCETHLDAMREVIEREIRHQIKENETWAMKVERRRWQQYHTIEIIQYLAESIERKVDLKHPDKVVRIDVLGKRTAISLLKPEEIFSVNISSCS